MGAASLNSKRSDRFDVVIVGAGPAGAKAAYELSRKGHTVLILEKERLPRYKPCGGGLSAKAIEQVGFDISPVVERRIKGAHLSFDSGNPVTVERPAIGIMVMRETFDNLLVGKAAGAGAVVREGHKVNSLEVESDGYRVEAGNERYECSVLVGADGANSIIAKKTGLRKNREMGIAIEREVSVEKGQIEAQGDYATLDFGTVPFGYAWIFPKRTHLSTGVYSAKKIEGLEEYLERFTSRQEVLKGCKTLSSAWHPIPLGGSKEVLHHHRALLVGDAAGLVDPFYAEGITFALKSATIAADRIDRFLAGKADALEGYSEEIYKEISSDFRYARFMHRLFYLNPGLSYRLLCKNRIVNRYFSDVVKGDIKFKEVFFKTITSLPRWIGAY